MFPCVKARRDDKAAEEAVEQLKANAVEFEQSFVAEYGIGLDESALRLGECARNGISGIGCRMFEQVPPDFFAGEHP